ncbi:MAG: heme exporter protein CcmD [Luteimonas sp.]|nr:heme exporter protein CcmD [Luteimonas sp.]
MSYLNYVIAAYMVFVVVLLWDFVATRVQIAQLLRATRLRAQRAKPAPTEAADGGRIL